MSLSLTAVRYISSLYVIIYCFKIQLINKIVYFVCEMLIKMSCNCCCQGEKTKYLDRVLTVGGILVIFSVLFFILILSWYLARCAFAVSNHCIHDCVMSVLCARVIMWLIFIAWYVSTWEYVRDIFWSTRIIWFKLNLVVFLSTIFRQKLKVQSETYCYG